MSPCELPLRSGENPFSSRRVAPGAARFLEPHPGAWRQWIDMLLRGPNRRWQILGPHGAGKSSLASRLAAELVQNGQEVLMLRGGKRGFEVAGATPSDVEPVWCSRLPPGQWWVLDGLEAVSWWTRWRWLRGARRAAGLIVLAHCDQGLPTLAKLEPQEELFLRAVRELTRPAPPRICDDDARQCFARAKGNFREALFLLYDVYEQRRDLGGADLSARASGG